jgi:branched-chain amino acid transport system substrate-binding protein
MTIIMTTGEAAIWRLRDKMPEGTIIGGRGAKVRSPATPK